MNCDITNTAYNEPCWHNQCLLINMEYAGTANTPPDRKFKVRVIFDGQISLSKTDHTVMTDEY